ncbi:MAG: MerC domain-containing protein [Myxococcota bacterium]
MAGTRSLGVRSFADGIGILGSAACALHCIAAPVLLVVGTALPASFATDEALHRVLLGAILPAALLAFGLGCWQHKDYGVLLLGAIGLLGLVCPVAAPHEQIGEIGERWLTIGSAGLLIAAHLRNFRRCRAEDCDHEGLSGMGS